MSTTTKSRQVLREEQAKDFQDLAAGIIEGQDADKDLGEGQDADKDLGEGQDADKDLGEGQDADKDLGEGQDADKDAQDAQGQARIKAVFASMGLGEVTAEKLIELIGGMDAAKAIAAKNVQDSKQVELEARIKGLAEAISLPFLEVGETFSCSISQDNGRYTVSVRRCPPPEKGLKGAKGGNSKGGGAKPLVVVKDGKSLGTFPSAAEFCRLHGVDVPARSSAVQVLKGKGYSVEHTE